MENERLPLREWRTLRGLTQQELADKAGMTQNSVSRIELGDIAPLPRTLVKLADALGVKTWQLVVERPERRRRRKARDIVRDEETERAAA